MSARKLKVKAVRQASPAQAAGVKAGDIISIVNGKKVEDVLDFHFYSIEDPLHIGVLRDSEEFSVKIEENGRDPGLVFEPMHPRTCGNHCIFCFTEQNPRGLRKELYFKDEDYRFSFLHGNFVTLTNIGQHDLNKIAEQRLTPLYVSVHAVDTDVRKKLLGIKNDDHLIDKLSFLVSHEIEIHAQVVLCPGINDGDVLEETITQLSEFYPWVRSVAVVPVGLTKHRVNLPKIQHVTPETAMKELKRGKMMQRKFRKKFKESFVYFSDEFYLKTGKLVPKANHYVDFWQIENGVGLVREFIRCFNRQQREFPRRLHHSVSILVVTGELAHGLMIRLVLPRLRKIKNLHAELAVACNSLYGPSVTVSGLISGQDVIDAAHDSTAEIIVLPEKVVNSKGLFLDEKTVAEVEHETGKRVVLIDSFGSLWSSI